MRNSSARLQRGPGDAVDCGLQVAQDSAQAAFRHTSLCRWLPQESQVTIARCAADAPSCRSSTVENVLSCMHSGILALLQGEHQLHSQRLMPKLQQSYIPADRRSRWRIPHPLICGVSGCPPHPAAYHSISTSTPASEGRIHWEVSTVQQLPTRA